MYGRATKYALFAICIWMGYKLSIFVNLVKHNYHQHHHHSMTQREAKLVTLVKSITVTETTTTSVVSYVTSTSYATLTISPTGNKERQGLSHIVIPIAFKPNQLLKLTRSLRFWDMNPPCVEGSWPNSHGDTNVTLTFLSHGDLTDQQMTKLQDFWWSLPWSVRKCFKEFEVRSAGLSKDTDNHTVGSRSMFETIVTGDCGLVNPRYVMWMEPDAVPIRGDWLNALDRSCRTEESFWVKGSALRHDVNASVVAQRYGTHFLYHINGNAIYNMAPNEYPQFYLNVLLPYLTAKGYRNTFFDTGLSRFLMDLNNIDIWRNLTHRFQYTALIQNRWGENYFVPERAAQFPETFIIHGGVPEGVD